MAKQGKSYDVSKSFSKNQHGSIKDQWCYSPAKDADYDYKKGIVKEIHLMGMENQHEPMYSSAERKSMSKMAKYEQD